MPAPKQYAVGIVGTDNGIAAFDNLIVIAVGTDIERRFAVFEIQVLQQARFGLPHDTYVVGSQLGAVAPAHGIEQVVRLFLRRDITVGHLVAFAQILRRHDPREKRRRCNRPARCRPGQRERTRSDGIAALDVFGRRSRNHERTGNQVDSRLAPSGRFARHGDRLDVTDRERHRFRAARRCKKHSGRVEHDFARILVLAARRNENRCGHNHGHQPYESFHITYIY